MDRLLVAEVVALLVCDKGFELRAPAVVPQREKAQEDDRKNVALVVGRFDRTAQGNRRLEQLLGERDDSTEGFRPAVACLAFFVADLRFAMDERGYFDLS